MPSARRTQPSTSHTPRTRAAPRSGIGTVGLVCQRAHAPVAFPAPRRLLGLAECPLRAGLHLARRRGSAMLSTGLWVLRAVFHKSAEFRCRCACRLSSFGNIEDISHVSFQKPFRHGDEVPAFPAPGEHPPLRLPRNSRAGPFTRADSTPRSVLAVMAPQFPLFEIPRPTKGSRGGREQRRSRRGAACCPPAAGLGPLSPAGREGAPPPKRERSGHLRDILGTERLTRNIQNLT